MIPLRSAPSPPATRTGALQGRMAVWKLLTDNFSRCSLPFLARGRHRVLGIRGLRLAVHRPFIPSLRTEAKLTPYFSPDQYSLVHYSNITMLLVAVTTLILFFATGMYSEKIAYAHKCVVGRPRGYRLTLTDTGTGSSRKRTGPCDPSTFTSTRGIAPASPSSASSDPPPLPPCHGHHQDALSRRHLNSHLHPYLDGHQLPPPPRRPTRSGQPAHSALRLPLLHSQQTHLHLHRPLGVLLPFPKRSTTDPSLARRPPLHPALPLEAAFRFPRYPQHRTLAASSSSRRALTRSLGKAMSGIGRSGSDGVRRRRGCSVRHRERRGGWDG